MFRRDGHGHRPPVGAQQQSGVLVELLAVGGEGGLDALDRQDVAIDPEADAERPVHQVLLHLQLRPGPAGIGLSQRRHADVGDDAVEDAVLGGGIVGPQLVGRLLAVLVQGERAHEAALLHAQNHPGGAVLALPRCRPAGHRLRSGGAGGRRSRGRLEGVDRGLGSLESPEGDSTAPSPGGSGGPAVCARPLFQDTTATARATTTNVAAAMRLLKGMVQAPSVQGRGRNVSRRRDASQSRLTSAGPRNRGGWPWPG